MIPVTKPYLPDRAKLDKYISEIYERNWLTNNGPLVQLFTERLEDYLGVNNLLLVNNGTIALQIAYVVLGIKIEGAEAITTPFSFVATSSSLKWENVKPVFSDINSETFCIDPSLIEDSITSSTKAIVPVHVFGNACDVDAIQEIAGMHQIKTIYDGAHAFGVKYKGNSILKYGDATTLSFHATKLFHSIEGGAIVFKNKDDLEKAKNVINFGIDGVDSVCGLGINAKMNEFQAAMGLCVLDEMDFIIEKREEIWLTYEKCLNSFFQFQKINSNASNNYAYFPVVFENEKKLKIAMSALNEHNIYPRRYFYPSLDTLDFINSKTYQSVSRNLSDRILCLPIYHELEMTNVNKIINLLIGS
jgi:dTDP-4-amino-4,6-dideoxygalactose transaminase